MRRHPKTILYPDSFDKSQWHITCPHCNKEIGFDGIFHWGWTQGCFGRTKITPTDFDGVVERNGHYLIFETKDVDRDVPQGQLWALERLSKAKSFTIITIWGKIKPKKFETIRAKIGEEMRFEIKGSGRSIKKLKKYVTKWFQSANKSERVY